MAPKFSKYPIATSVSWTARYKELQSAGPNDEDYKLEKAQALQKIRHFEGREDVRNGIVEHRNALRELRQVNANAQATLGNDGVSLDLSVTSSLNAAIELDKAESEFAEFEKRRRASRYEQGWKTRESKFWFDVDNDPAYIDGIIAERKQQSAYLAKQASKLSLCTTRGPGSDGETRDTSHGGQSTVEMPGMTDGRGASVGGDGFTVVEAGGKKKKGPFRSEHSDQGPGHCHGGSSMGRGGGGNTGGISQGGGDSAAATGSSRGRGRGRGGSGFLRGGPSSGGPGTRGETGWQSPPAVFLQSHKPLLSFLSPVFCC